MRRLPTSGEAGTTMRHLLHDMRTPVTQIIGYAEMLQDEARDRAQDELVGDLEQIREAAQHLLAFVESVFQPDASAPAAEPQVAESASPRRGAASNAEPQSGAILVIDDEARNREQLARRLERLGYEVTTVDNGRDALEAVHAKEFDLLLLDVLMPGMSGLEVLESLRHSHSPAELPIIMTTSLGESEDVVEALQRGANDYVTKPFDLPVLLARISTQQSLRRASREIASLAQQLEIRNAFIRRTFGRYVSDEVVASLLDDPVGLELRGTKRRITILLSDLRGFSTLAETLEPPRVVSLLSGYLSAMSDVIQSHGGTIDELQGDGILALFGAPIAHEDDAERAVLTALEMQLAVGVLNAHHRRVGLPELQMGIGIATGDAIVGNIGSERRAKYGAVGRPVNLAARLESYTTGGDVLIDDATRSAIATPLEISRTRDVHPKGIESPVRIHCIEGLAGDPRLRLPVSNPLMTPLSVGLSVRVAIVEGSDVTDRIHSGSFSAVSLVGALLRTEEMFADSTSLRIELMDERGDPRPGAFYATVAGSETGRVVFTTRSPALEAVLQRILGGR